MIDTQVKIRGFRVEMGEIEVALGRHPAVKEAVVTAHPLSSGEKRLVGHIVPHEGISPTAGELREFLLITLADYMVPSRFVFLDRLPLTPSGKVHRRGLSAPEFSHSAAREGMTPLNGPTESAIGKVWVEMLDLSVVGPTESFFELGGTSVTMVRVQKRLQESLGREVAIAVLFQFPTIQGLAQHLDGAGRQTAIRAENARDRATRQREALLKAQTPALRPQSRH